MATFETELESLHELELEGELEGEAGHETEGIFGTIGNLLGGLLGEGEAEFEGEGEMHELHEMHELELEGELEGEGEFETELNPARKIYPDAMMEHLAHMASEAETEQEAAEHFLPLIGLAAKKLLPMVAKAVSPALKRALPRVARAVTRVEPRLTRGIATIAKGLHRSPSTRALLRAVPSIARRTVFNVARSAAAGRPVTPATAVRTLAAQTRRVLGTRPARAQALRRSRVMDLRLHRQLGPGVVRPHGWQYRRYWYGGVPGAPAPAMPPAAGWPTGVRPGVPGIAATTRPAYCPPCSCGGQVAAMPAYCRCCGQVLR
jgi:hypothetical protein